MQSTRKSAEHRSHGVARSVKRINYSRSFSHCSLNPFSRRYTAPFSSGHVRPARQSGSYRARRPFNVQSVDSNSGRTQEETDLLCPGCVRDFNFDDLRIRSFLR